MTTEHTITKDMAAVLQFLMPAEPGLTHCGSSTCHNPANNLVLNTLQAVTCSFVQPPPTSAYAHVCTSSACISLCTCVTKCVPSAQTCKFFGDSIMSSCLSCLLALHT